MNMMDSAYKSSTVEALVLASPEPLSARKIAQVIEEMTPSEVAKAIAGLNERYVEAGISFRIRELAGGYQFYILPEYVGFVEELFSRRRKLRLTRAALETTAIIAYRQPVTKGDIEHIRGVASDGVLHNLVDKKLVSIVGRADTVGKPLQYGTTDEFLKFFGLNSIKDLPKMAEIEELVAASEPKDQTELTLVREGEEEMVKLNVADGTFDPATRETDDDDNELIPIQAVAPIETEEIQESDETGEINERIEVSELTDEVDQLASENLAELLEADETDETDDADDDEMIPIESGLPAVDEELEPNSETATDLGNVETVDTADITEIDEIETADSEESDELETQADNIEKNETPAELTNSNRMVSNSTIPQGIHGTVGPAEIEAEESEPVLSVANSDLTETDTDEADS